MQQKVKAKKLKQKNPPPTNQMWIIKWAFNEFAKYRWKLSFFYFKMKNLSWVLKVWNFLIMHSLFEIESRNPLQPTSHFTKKYFSFKIKLKYFKRKECLNVMISYPKRIIDDSVLLKLNIRKQGRAKVTSNCLGLKKTKNMIHLL